MRPMEPPREGSAASDDQSFSWDVPWRPTTVPLPEVTAPAAYFLSPSGLVSSPPDFASPPTEPRYRKRRGYGWWLLLTLLIGLALGAAGATEAQYLLDPIQANGDQQPAPSPVPSATPAPVFSPTPTASPQPTPTSTPALSPTPTGPTWTTVQHFSGSGTTNTPSATVPKTWRIAWQCNPASSPTGPYEVAITLYTTDGKAVDTTLDTTCKPTNTAGIDPQYQAGTFYLQIRSTADWDIQIQVVQ